jgi:hypothetical protein
MRVALAAIAAALLTGQAEAAPRDWPALRGDDAVPQCAQAFDLARQAYQSDAFYLHEPLSVAAGFPSHVVLQRNGLDISGGDALNADADIFERIDFDAGRLYWQRNAAEGRRLVVSETRRGWRGDGYGPLSRHCGVIPFPPLRGLAALIGGLGMGSSVDPSRCRQPRPLAYVHHAQWYVRLDDPRPRQ